MNTEYYKKFEPVFNSWYIKRLLGEGSYGKVFEIQREDFGTTYKAALKAMTIPSSESEIKSVMADGMDEASVRSYYENFVEDIVKEFVLMSKLKGNSNIVSYEDHMVIEHKNEIGWDILIRMELLTPLFDYVKSVDLRRKDVIQLGIDMCKALELCQKYNIIHRDIKPENIFVSENGDFKLGDFGIARTLEQTSGMLSKKGTQAYMAPEIYREESYGSNVDIYSLGIVMYRLLNENRTPFLPAYPAPITHADREAAIKKRISGAPLPKPTNADGRLAEIVLKACRYDPKERYFSPMEMREELEAILYNKEEAKIIYPKGDETPIKSIKYVKTGDEVPHISPENQTEDMVDGKRKNITERTSGTEGFFESKNIDDTDQTESGFESQWDDEDKTEGMFGKKEIKRNKKLIWKNWITYASASVVIIAMCIGGFLLFNKSPQVISCSVTDVGELNDPIEIGVPFAEMSESEQNKIVNRLEAYGESYYIDKSNGIVALEKDRLGETDQQALATIHMIFGQGNYIFDSPMGSENHLTNEDIEKAVFTEDKENNCSYINVKLNDLGVSKLSKIEEEILALEQDHFLYLYIDDNLRCSDAVFEVSNKEIVIEGGYDGKQYLSLNPLLVTAHAEQEANAIQLSPNYIRLMVSIINDGALSKSYEITIDEKYGLVVEENTVDEEVNIEESEEKQDESEQVITSGGNSNKKTNTTSGTSTSNQSTIRSKQESTQQTQQEQITQQTQQEQITQQTQQEQQVQAQQQTTTQSTQESTQSNTQPAEAPPLIMGWDD